MKRIENLKLRKLACLAMGCALATSVVLSGCDDEDFSEDGEYSEESQDTEQTQDNEQSQGELDSSDEESMNLSDPSQFPLGTCQELDGTTVVISILANDNATSWDMESEQDQTMAARMYSHMSKGLDWITEQGKNYGKDITFISDFTQNDDLMYTVTLDADFADGYAHRDVTKGLLDSEGFGTTGAQIMQKYGAQNILFAFYFNEPEDTNMISAAAPFINSGEYADLPYDVLLLSPYVYGQEQGPATYAHETLHLFGAPDFYTPDVDGTNCGITQEFSDYCMQNHANEIMTNNYDIVNMRVDLDKVTNELTDLTAFYIGWIDSNDELEQWGVANSEHNR